MNIGSRSLPLFNSHRTLPGRHLAPALLYLQLAHRTAKGAPLLSARSSHDYCFVRPNPYLCRPPAMVLQCMRSYQLTVRHMTLVESVVITQIYKPYMSCCVALPSRPRTSIQGLAQGRVGVPLVPRGVVVPQVVRWPVRHFMRRLARLCSLAAFR
jgi:hypothetical protein